MLIDGEKYACEACVRGHRVSTCQHNDRPLTHINKKGRPVSQCPHCRGLRKARAAHVACECGAKPHHKGECNDNDSKSDLNDVHSDSNSDPGADRQRPCCCSHGLRCTCALKKDHLNPVPEVSSPLLSRKRATSASKPRLIKAGSDNALTVFTNGHHKPVHKHNDSAHKCGLPYKIPIPHSVHGNADVARRSTDSLPLTRRKDEPHSQLHETFKSAQQDTRLVRSEHGSPEPRATMFREHAGPLPPLDLAYPPLNENTSVPFPDDYVSSPPPQEAFYDPQDEPPLLSAGLNTTSDWSDLNLPLDSAAYSAAFGQPPSYVTLDNTSVGPQCLASTPSSGDGSDTASDYLSHSANQGSPFRPDLTATSSAEARSINRLSSSSFTSMPQISNLSTSNPLSLDSDFQATSASPTGFEEPSILHADAFERHGFTVHDAQKLAHPDTPTEAMNNLSLPVHGDDISQSLWNSRFDPPQGTFVSQEMVEGVGAGVGLSHWR